MPFGLGPQRSTLVPSFCTSTAETNVQVPTRSLAIWAAALPVGSAAPRNASDSVATASMKRLFTLAVATLSLAFLGAALPTGNAAAQMAKDLVGTWTFVSAVDVQKDGTKVEIGRAS